MKTMLLMFLGRNTANIFADYQKFSGEVPDLAVIVYREADKLLNEVQDEYTIASTVENAIKGAIEALTNGVIVTVICNGGTTAQQVPVIKELVTWSVSAIQSGKLPGELKFIEVTRDGITQF